MVHPCYCRLTIADCRFIPNLTRRSVYIIIENFFFDQQQIPTQSKICNRQSKIIIHGVSLGACNRCAVKA